MAFLDDAGGYTPVPDKLVREYDFTTAYVWGKVWRYCQMESGTCTASHETIAKRAGMSRRALIKHLDILIKDGYIEDLTPNLKNKPHTYSTKKGEEKIKSTVQKMHTELDESAGIAQPDEPAMQDLPPDYAKNAQSTMQKMHSKKDSKKEDNNAANAALLPDTKYSQLLFEKLAVEFGAKGRRPPAKFPSLACKRKFDARAKYLNGNTATAIDRALEKGIMAVTGVTDFIAKWNPPPLPEPKEQFILTDAKTGERIT